MIAQFNALQEHIRPPQIPEPIKKMLRRNVDEMEVSNILRMLGLHTQSSTACLHRIAVNVAVR